MLYSGKRFSIWWETSYYIAGNVLLYIERVHEKLLAIKWETSCYIAGNVLVYIERNVRNVFLCSGKTPCYIAGNVLVYIERNVRNVFLCSGKRLACAMHIFDFPLLGARARACGLGTVNRAAVHGRHRTRLAGTYTKTSFGRSASREHGPRTRVSVDRGPVFPC